jgi:hypothetical protein
MTDIDRTVEMLGRGQWWDADAPAERARTWTIQRTRQIRGIPASQWNLLAQEGRDATTYGQYYNTIETLLKRRQTDPESERDRIRAIWRRQPGLAESLLSEMKAASDESHLVEAFRGRLLEFGKDSPERSKLTEIHRLAMARAFICAVVTGIRSEKALKE